MCISMKSSDNCNRQIIRLAASVNTRRELFASTTKKRYETIDLLRR